MQRLIDADKLRSEMYEEAFEKDSDMQRWDSGCWIRYKLFENVIAQQPTIDAIPLSAVHKAAKKLAYIHQQIDLYGDRPDLHDEEYWLEYLMDEEWKDEEIDLCR